MTLYVTWPPLPITLKEFSTGFTFLSHYLLLSLWNLLQLNVINDLIVNSGVLFSALILYFSSAKFDTMEHVFLPGSHASLSLQSPGPRSSSQPSGCPSSVTILFSPRCWCRLTSVLGSTSLLPPYVLGVKMPCGMKTRLKPSIFISQGCHNKLPQTKWLKITEIHSLAVVEARSPHSRLSRVGSFWKL